MKKIRYQILLSLLFSFWSLSGYAWNHSIEIGYGYSHDPNHTPYNNSGVLINGDFLLLGENAWTRWSLFGSVGQWYTDAPLNRRLTTAAISLSLRVYPLMIPTTCYPFYLFLASGPSLLSSRRYGFNTQAQNITFQSAMGLGAEFKHIDLNLRWQHYSNANLSKPNEGFNILYLLSIGYLF